MWEQLQPSEMRKDTLDLWLPMLTKSDLVISEPPKVGVPDFFRDALGLNEAI